MNPDPVSRPAVAGEKRPFDAVSHSKRLRSKIPRRKRSTLLPIVNGLVDCGFDAEIQAESSSSCFQSEVSFESSVGIAQDEGMKRPRLIKGDKSITDGDSEDKFRRITRLYARRKAQLRSEERTKKKSEEIGISPDSGANEKKSELKTAISEVSQVSGGFPDGNLKKNGVLDGPKEKFPEISESSCLESVTEANNTKIPNSTVNQSSGLQTASDIVSRDERTYDLDLDSDLACSEQLSNEDEETSDYSTCNEMTLSEVESELFQRESLGNSSDYSSSLGSSDHFSERSSENTAPSATFSLFLQLMQQFTRSGFLADANGKPAELFQETSQEFISLTFDEDDDEESYKRFRSRERNEVVLHDFTEDYSSSTDYGEIILKQRLLMVNWMVEHSQALELHHETLFLGVSLMDRFLSRGHFQSERNLQLVGIASVTLATRLEENQPYNSIRRKSFTVGSNVYGRCEVVAMEWLLLEVLNFQCFLPTTHNFLWFYLKAAKADEEVESLSRYLAVLALLDPEILSFWPSTVAAGLVILACLATNRESSCHTVIETHVRTKNDDLPECIQSLEWLVKYAC